MKVLRKPELKRELLVYAAITVVAAVVGFITAPLCGVLVLSLGAVLCAAHLWFARKRYRQMAELAQSLDRILHGEESVLISGSNEGELSILSSELHKMTARLKEQSDLLAADKIRLTEAIQDIFHQIRTPLTSMNLIVSMLGEEDLSYERRLQLTHELKRQLERVQWLVETLLKLSKIDAGTAQFRSDSVSVAVLIDKAADSLRIPMELREQTLTAEVSDERFTGDLSWTAEALSNLLKNCMEHTPIGGAISVTAAETALFTELVIEDNGPGIAKEDTPHLFDRFYKGKSASDESVGIGLALARSIVATQNGTLTAANVPTGGARFTMRFYKSVI